MMGLTANGAAVTSHGIWGTRDGFGWSDEPSFQVEAVADNPSAVTLEELRQMLQALLADRFKLRFHLEKKEVPGYSLVVSKRGHKLKLISGDYAESVVFFQGRSTMDRFVRTLNAFLGDQVRIVDKTGLQGAFEYDFEPVPRVGDNPAGQRGGPAPGLDGSLAERAENLSARLEKQLGLRLQSEKAISIVALVIDSVERPSPN
jgi:uncharacterized protein (TIGR03435 family)